MTRRTLLVFVACSLAIYAGVALAQFPTPSTAKVQSLKDGLHVGFKTSDRIGFHDATPIPKPVITSTAGANIVAALAAQGILATATPTATSTSSSTSTPTATATPTSTGT